MRDLLGSLPLSGPCYWQGARWASQSRISRRGTSSSEIMATFNMVFQSGPVFIHSSADPAGELLSMVLHLFL